MGDIVTIITRLLAIGVALALFTFLPMFVWKLKKWYTIKNAYLRIFLRIVAMILVLIMVLFALSLILGSVWNYEKSSGNCYGLSCPIQLQ